MCEENPDMGEGGEPEPTVDVVIRLTESGAGAFRKAIRHWETWHNCKGYAEHFDKVDPAAAALHRGNVVMDFVEAFEETEGIDLDAMELESI